MNEMPIQSKARWNSWVLVHTMADHLSGSRELWISTKILADRNQIRRPPNSAQMERIDLEDRCIDFWGDFGGL
jgi:hypothetical protein